MQIKLKYGDYIIIAVVLLLALLLILSISVHSSGRTLYAEVWSDGEMIERVLLKDDTRRTIDINGHNTIVIEGRTAKIESACCHDQVCVRTGTLSKAGEAAVCLPYRVVLKLTGEGNEVDAVAS